ncbi:alpha/beta hydrolase-fold protein [Rhabdobacter roseus]|uniref:S-formylglutathione hydrolase FrmB n=1 Tax=Rhabdobacter roseus TaxID=1655419 RepID=A0A840TST2_9BACT|nr:alpha/beta hydrolase family protein [Rhabdobacter roseus]MBB5286354.1 S-formylglutathione hydrolase FrmB [Rhabdobacter roseus]
MKKTTTLFLCLLGLCAYAQPSQLKESLTIKSTTLGKDVKYSIYLPAGYEQSNRGYPILYLLHGYSDDETGWTQFGEADRLADEAIGSGKAAPMIIAMPDGGVSWYINSADGKQKYEDFFINEFIPHIEKTYRVRAQKRYRAIAGLSMGGYGTLVMALKHPDLFAAAAPLSAGVLTDDELVASPDDNWNRVFALPYGKDLKGKDRLSEHYYRNSPLKMVATANVEDLKKVRYYIDCGDDDFLIKGNMALHAALIDQKIPHEFRVRDGGHTWTYWRTALPEVLSFVSDSFHQK